MPPAGGENEGEEAVKVLRLGRVPGWVQPLIIGCITIMFCGCGAVSTGGTGTPSNGESVLSSTSERPLPPPVCDNAPATNRDASTLIVLDWDGGVNPLDPTIDINPLDPLDLPIYSGVTTVDDAEAFKEAVRLRIEEILCDLDPVDMRVILGVADDYPGATRVYLTIDLAPSDGNQAGQADYDPCNRHVDDRAIIWGGRFVEAAGAGWSREAWVNMLANVTTHEIGHTLGFAHPDQLGIMIDPDEAQRAIMLSSHKIPDLAAPQVFLISQNTCAEPIGVPGSGVRYQITGADVRSFDPKTARTLGAADGEDDGCPVLTCPQSHESEHAALGY